MRAFLRKLLDIDSSEEGQVYILLLISFFQGAFLVTYDVAVNTLFLDQYVKVHGEDSIAIGIMLSGGLGIFVTVIFAFLQRKVSFDKLSVITQFSLMLLTAFLTYSFQMAGEQIVQAEVHGELTPVKIITPELLLLYSFALLGPLNALTLLGFYGTVSRAFTLKQEKRITGTVDLGFLFATSLAFFLVTFAFTNVPTKHYFFYSTGAAIVALFLQSYFVVKHRTQQLSTLVSQDTRRGEGDNFIKNKYIRLLGFMFLVAVLITLFVEYSFLSASSAAFEKTEDLTYFLGFYGGALTILSFAMQIFAGDKIIEKFGVKISIVVLPVLISIFFLMAAIIGNFWGIRVIYDKVTRQDIGGTMLFFVCIAGGKLFLSLTKDTFEDPILKNFFLPIDSFVRHNIQTSIEGVFKQLAWAFAGLVLFGIYQLMPGDALAQNREVVICASTVLISVFYFVTAIKLFESYQFTLLESLNKQKNRLSFERKEYSPINVMKKELQCHEPDKIIYTLKLMERIEPVMLEVQSDELVYDPSPRIRSYAIQKLTEHRAIASISTLRNVIKLDDSPEIKRIANEAIEKLNEAETLAISNHRMYKLAKSLDWNDRFLAAKLIHKIIDDTNIQVLIDLMRDPNTKVKSAALVSAGKTRRQEFFPLLLENLSSPLFGNIAAASLYSIGESIIPSLESTFYKSGQTIEVMLKIIQMYGRFGGEKVVAFLWNKIDFPDRRVVNQVLLSLSGCRFQAEGSKALRILQTIEQEIGNSAWLIAAYAEVGNDDDVLPLKMAIVEEIEKNDNDIFMLLSLVYDPNSIQLVRQNIESRTSEGVLYAIELLNVFVAEELKPVLFPLLDELPVQEKINRLQEYYLRERFDQVTILMEIINQDYNSINRWTKACAMYRYLKMPGALLTNDIVANLFNPDPLLREIAAYAMYTLDRVSYHESTKRIDPEIKRELDFIMLTQDDESNRKHLIYEKVLFLKEVKALSTIPGVLIANIAQSVSEVKFRRGDTVLQFGAKGNAPIYAVQTGLLEVRDGNQTIARLVRGDLVGENLVLETDLYQYDVVVIEDCVLYKIEKDHFYELMSQSHEMTEGVIAGFVEHRTVLEHDHLAEELLDLRKS
ncbi:MAG: cyclic nucleotide-binding domain-containing protein [Cytophagaceae bacterium]|jgi:ATP/ADP translocase|nr:cyclic nucleotide-binding domain-containing protein [Cytophagaceae bacterium]